MSVPRPNTRRRVAVYCGASPRALPVHLDAARAFGALLAQRDVGLVYGGCRTGLMGALADGCLDAGGEVIGVIPDVIRDREVAHLGLTELLRVPDMHTRKAVMTAFADGFVALPGGYGTLDELFEALTWRMIGTHDKPIGLYDVQGYWRQLVAFLDDATAQHLVAPQARDLFFVEPDAATLMDRLLPK